MKKQFTNKARYLGLKLTAIVFAFLLFVSGEGWGQTTIAVQDFETTPATPTWSYSATGGATNTTSSKYNGAQSYRMTASDVLTMSNVNISGYTSVTLSVAFAATGADANEDLLMDISYDNGATWVGTGSIKLVDGFSNANININTTNTLDPTTVSSNPWLTNISASETQINVRFRAIGLDASEYYFIDDVKLTGTSSSTPTKLAITLISPTSPTAGSTFNVTVQAQDGSNNPANVTGATAFDLTTNGNAGTIGGTTAGTILSGTSSITVTGVTLSSAGTGATITATRSSGDVLTVGTSSTFNVLAAASQLAFVSLPSSGTANTNLTSFTIEARRPDNTVDNTYTANVVISKATGSGSISGTTTKACVAGVATFNDIQFNAGDVYTISAASGSLTGATSGSITVLASQPTNSPTVAVFSNVTVNSMDLGWTAASGGADGYIVIMRSGASYSTTDPVDGTTYTAGTVIGDGTVVYSGSATSASVTSLSAGTTYSFEISSYNGSGSSINYKATLPLQGQRSTLFSEPTTQPTALTFTNVTAAGMTIGCTGGNGTNRIFVVKSGSAVDFVPVDGIVYTPNLSFTSGTGLGTNSDNKVVAVTGTSAVVTGLSSNTTYYVAVYELNGSSTTINYLTTSSLAGSRSTLSSVPSVPTSLSFGSITYNSFIASFVAPGTPPTGYLVLRKTGSAVTGTPVAGSEYTLGNTIGTGEVVYVGTSVWTAFAQTGLIDNTAYHYAIYSYNGSGTLTNYSATALTGNQSTYSVSSPTANPSTSLTSTGFTANWDASAGASSYRLDVATNSNFYTNETIASEGFENSLTLFTETTGTGSFYTGNSSSGDSPASSPFSQNNSFGYGKTAGTNTITSSDINTSQYSNVQLNFKLASFSVPSGNGADASDIVTVSISPDGGANYYSTLRIKGNSNATWAFDATGSASTTYDGNVSSVDFSAASSGLNSNGLSDITITDLPAVSNLKVRITLLNDNAAERWVIDNFMIIGYQNTILTNYNDLTVSGTSQAVTGLTPNTTYYYRVRAVGGNSTSANSGTITQKTNAASGSAFNGSVNTTWENAANWDNGLPGAITDVTRPADKTVFVTDIAECNNLTIASKGALTVNSNKYLLINGNFLIESDVNGTGSFIGAAADYDITGTTTVKRYLTGNVFHQLGLPISNTIAAGSDVGQTGKVFLGCTLDSYNETNNTYTSYSATNSVSPNIGYVVNSGALAKTLSFTGSLNTGDKTYSAISYSGTGANDLSKGYNMIPNPYPSAINGSISTWAKTNVNTSIWVWDQSSTSPSPSGNYLTWNGSTGTLTGGIIPAMQAFFIQTNDVSPSVTIPNTARTHSGQAYYKSTITDELTLKVKGNNYSDAIIVTFTPNTTNVFDNNFDVRKLYGLQEAPQLFSICNNEKLSINGLAPITTSVAVPVGLQVGNNGNYVINADGVNTFSFCSSIILEDLKTNTTQNLMQNPVYNFTASTTDNANRFVLHFATSVGVNEIGKTNGGIYAYDNNIYVNTNEQIKQISVYNAMGQLIKTVNNVNGLQKINMNGHATGYYIVKVISDKNVYSEKVLIK